MSRSVFALLFLAAPGDLVLEPDRLVWTDRHTGELLATPIE